MLTTCHGIWNLSSGGMLKNINSRTTIPMLTTCHATWNLSSGGMLGKIKNIPMLTTWHVQCIVWDSWKDVSTMLVVERN